MPLTAPPETFNNASRSPLFLPDDDDIDMQPPSSQNRNSPHVSDGTTSGFSPHDHHTLMHSLGALGGEKPTQIILEYPTSTTTRLSRTISHDGVLRDSSQRRLNRGTLGLRSSLRHIAQMHPHIHPVFEERSRDIIQTITSLCTTTAEPITPTPPTSTILQAVQEQDPKDLGHGRNELPAIKSEEADFNSASKSDIRPDQSRDVNTAAQPGAVVTASRQRVILEGVYISDSDSDDEEKAGNGEQPPDSSSEDTTPALQSEKAQGKQKAVEPDQRPSNDESDLPLGENLASYEARGSEEGEIDADRWEVQHTSNPSSVSGEVEEGELDEDELLSDGTGAGSEADMNRLMRGIERDAGDAGQYDKMGQGGEPNYAAIEKESNDELDSLFGEDSGPQPTLTRKRVRSLNDPGPPAKRAAPRDPIFVQDSSSDEAPVASSSNIRNRPRSPNATPKSRLVVPRRNRAIVSNVSQQKNSITEAIELVEQKFRINVQTIRRLHTGRSTIDPEDLDVRMKQAIINLLEAKWWITLEDVRNSRVAELLSSFKDDDDHYSPKTRKLVYDFFNALHERFKGGTIYLWRGTKSTGLLDNIDFDFR